MAENYLDSWSAVIQRQSEQRQREEEEMLAEMQRLFPEQVQKIKGLDHEELLNHFQAYSQRSCADPRQTKVYQDLATECRDELLRRLAG